MLILAGMFAVLAAGFAALAYRDLRRATGGPRPVRRAWLRLAVIFALVALLQLALHFGLL